MTLSVCYSITMINNIYISSICYMQKMFVKPQSLLMKHFSQQWNVPSFWLQLCSICSFRKIFIYFFIWATSSRAWNVMYYIYIFEFFSKVLKMRIWMKMIVFLCKYLWIHDQNFFFFCSNKQKYLLYPFHFKWFAIVKLLTYVSESTDDDS